MEIRRIWHRRGDILFIFAFLLLGAVIEAEAEHADVTSATAESIVGRGTLEDLSLKLLNRVRAKSYISFEETNSYINSAPKVTDARELLSMALRIDNETNLPDKRAKSFYLFELAAQLGSARALYECGLNAEEYHVNGKAVAKQLYRRSADGGYPDAFYALWHLDAVATEQSSIDSIDSPLLSKAIELGSPKAEYSIGLAFLKTGKIEEAKSCLQKAAAHGDPLATLLLLKMFARGDFAPAEPLDRNEYWYENVALGIATPEALQQKTNLFWPALDIEKLTDRIFRLSDERCGPAMATVARSILDAPGLNEKDLQRAAIIAQGAIEADDTDGFFLCAFCQAALGDLEGCRRSLDAGKSVNDWRCGYANRLVATRKFGLKEALAQVSISKEIDYQNFEMGRVSNSHQTAPIALKINAPIIPPDLTIGADEQRISATFVVNTDGKPVTIQVMGCREDRIRKIISDTIAGWDFKPALQDGNPVARPVRVPIRLVALDHS